MSLLESPTEITAFENKCFDAWMAKVDAYCLRRVGVSVHDLDDCPFRDWFEDGETASAAGRAAIGITRGDF